jgi:hypothetical protein
MISNKMTPEAMDHLDPFLMNQKEAIVITKNLEDSR